MYFPCDYESRFNSMVYMFRTLLLQVTWRLVAFRSKVITAKDVERPLYWTSTLHKSESQEVTYYHSFGITKSCCVAMLVTSSKL